MTKERIQIVAISQRMIDEHLEVVFSLRIKRNEYNLIYNIGGGVKEVPLLADAAVVTFVPYAIKHGLDIYSEYYAYFVLQESYDFVTLLIHLINNRLNIALLILRSLNIVPVNQPVCKIVEPYDHKISDKY